MINDVEVAIAAAAAGAEVAREMFGQRLDRIDKDGEDFATAADVEAERRILAVLRAARPDDAVLGEEGGHQGAVGAARQWLVDPLCGTLNYTVRSVEVLAHPDFAQHFRPRVLSTTLALAWIAAGKHAAYLSDGRDPSTSVHFAAGIALCQAAGCVVTGIDGRPIGPASRGLVAAADAETHRLMMSMAGYSS